jgi:hypothetical protein
VPRRLQHRAVRERRRDGPLPQAHLRQGPRAPYHRLDGLDDARGLGRRAQPPPPLPGTSRDRPQRDTADRATRSRRGADRVPARPDAARVARISFRLLQARVGDARKTAFGVSFPFDATDALETTTTDDHDSPRSHSTTFFPPFRSSASPRTPTSWSAT